MRWKYGLLTLLLLSALLLTSCALLPEEEAVRTAPVIRTYVREAYPTTQVMRGDLIDVTRVSCRYVPVQSVSLAFSLGDEYIDKMMVQVGASVEAGQLLAQLQLGDLEERIESARSAIAELDLRYAYMEKLYDLDLRRSEISSIGLDPQAKEEARARIQEEHALRIQEVTDALELQRLTLASLEEDLAERQIRAPFSGTITYISHYKEGDLSDMGVSVMQLVDSTMSLFRANTEHWHLFQPGDEFEIIVSKQPYHAIVTDEAALGLEETEKVEGKRANVYFALSEPSFELEDGDTGLVEVVLSEHLDVLYVPKETVSSLEGQPIVYYQREDGMKAYKPVEVGVTIGDYTEILSGLTEGEIIIAD